MGKCRNTDNGGCSSNVSATVSISSLVPLDNILEHKQNMFESYYTGYGKYATFYGKQHEYKCH